MLSTIDIENDISYSKYNDEKKTASEEVGSYWKGRLHDYHFERPSFSLSLFITLFPLLRSFCSNSPGGVR